MIINAQIDEKLHERVKAVSQATGVSVSFKIREALEKWAEAWEIETMTEARNTEREHSKGWTA